MHGSAKVLELLGCMVDSYAVKLQMKLNSFTLKISQYIVYNIMLLTQYVTGPVIIMHICTSNLLTFRIFNYSMFESTKVISMKF